MKTGTKVVLGVGVAVVAIGVVTYLNRVEPSGEGLVSEVERAERPVEVTEVQPTELTETLVHTGVLEASRDVVLTSEVGGKVRRVLKDLGDSCSQLEALVQLDAEMHGMGLAQASAGVEQARAALVQAERDLDRARRLHERNVATANDLERAESGVRAARAQVKQAQAAAGMAHRSVRETTIRCPFDGVVAQRFVDVGQLVGPQTPLVRLVGTGDLKLTLAVSAAELGRLLPEQTATLADPAAPSLRFEGRVSRLGVAADPITRRFPVELTVPAPANAPGPRPGQVVRALIGVARHTGVLVVPEDAVVVAAEGPHVFIADDGKARQTQVTTGARVDGQLIIDQGLSPGDQVVVVGHEGLADGDAVAVVRVAPARASTPGPTVRDGPDPAAPPSSAAPTAAAAARPQP